ncbi:hypothetical protein ABW20_dc0109801 [Dactylellina cionopaga]|nr:hypothetical protein ABW20_dc0109801 [Dactylellina cionopaga]
MAFKRYIQKKGELNPSERQFIINSEGIIEGVSDWQTQRQQNASPIYNALQNCKLAVNSTLRRLATETTVNQTSIRLGVLSELCQQHYTKLDFPWLEGEIQFSAWRKSVEFAFFGGDGNWNPIIFDSTATIDQLDIEQIKNRIAALGESIGWTPDIHLDDSEENVRFQQEVLVTCFFCCEEQPLWRMTVLHCHHASCVDCVKRNFKLCLEDTSLLPPRCCYRYPNVYASIACDNINELKKLARCIVTGKNPAPVSNCYKCKADIFDGSVLGDIAFCITCDETTCIKCGIQWHEFERTGCHLVLLRRFISTVRENGWAQCYRCGIVVEKAEGNGRKRPTLNVVRDRGVFSYGEKYTEKLRANHKVSAIENERKYERLVDGFNVLRLLKTYQSNVVQQVKDLRKRLKELREKEKENEGNME